MSDNHLLRDKELSQLKEDYKNTPIPEQGKKQMEESIERAKKEKQKVVRFRHYKQAGLTAAAALALLVIAPNVSQSAAMAMGNLPIIGPIVKVITIRDYKVDEEHRSADVNVPKIEVDSTDPKASQSVDTVNQNVDQYISTLIDQFKADTADNQEANQSLDVHYDIVTNTDTWFTLKLSVLQIQASGDQSYRYYNIDKRTGEIAPLKDLFRDGADYKTVVSDNIKKQMADQMAKDENVYYWLNDTEVPDENFKSISDDQDYYMDKDGHLVIAFDEYEVAPGYMGAVEFTIPDEVIAGIRR